MTKKFTIYWVRHGLSCANIVLLTRKLYLDPDLTYVGYKQLIETRKKIKELGLKYDYVYCSNLSRAIQSCLILTQKYENLCKMFNKFIFKKEDLPCEDKIPIVKKQIINISPYIKETGLGRDNNPIKPEKFLKKYMKLINEKIMDIKVIAESEWSNSPNLLKFVYNMELVGEINNRKILAVSHCNAIKKLLKKYYKGMKDTNFRIQNGSIIKAEYEINDDEIECVDFEILYNIELNEKLLEKQYKKHCEFRTEIKPIEL